MVAYQEFNDGKMTDFIPSDQELSIAFTHLPRSNAKQPE